MREEKNRLDPVDMEFDVGPGFLFLSDSQEGQTSPEHGECSDEDGKKPLEEATGSIDEVSDTSSDDDSCVIVEDTHAPKDPKFQEHVVDQEQRNKKTAEISTKILSPVAQPVHPVEHPGCPKAETHDSGMTMSIITLQSSMAHQKGHIKQNQCHINQEQQHINLWQ
ncbi:Transmembrane gamma-carboxyglutamic acid protein 3 [Microtus ochrogaster]|uniref:Transmembrane gamma-carboxyglutamic acid protein 3 n=1 Tax=Microtus ochrogaster TaxID=79684 RepID=A0A8J6GTF6_MICOH|nr:Transmembrane gamma-carboxyglutamic acid protein 3 [Microtus ochrogaster]